MDFIWQYDLIFKPSSYDFWYSQCLSAGRLRIKPVVDLLERLQCPRKWRGPKVHDTFISKGGRKKAELVDIELSQTPTEIKCGLPAFISKLAGPTTERQHRTILAKQAQCQTPHQEDDSCISGSKPASFGAGKVIVSSRYFHPSVDRLGASSRTSQSELFICDADEQRGQTFKVASVSGDHAKLVIRRLLSYWSPILSYLHVRETHNLLPISSTLTFWNLACSGVLSPELQVLLLLQD